VLVPEVDVRRVGGSQDAGDLPHVTPRRRLLQVQAADTGRAQQSGCGDDGDDDDDDDADGDDDDDDDGSVGVSMRVISLTSPRAAAFCRFRLQTQEGLNRVVVEMMVTMVWMMIVVMMIVVMIVPTTRMMSHGSGCG
jgi:hypothetical protein